MTLLLGESDVAEFLSMKEVVPSVEESFRQEAGSGTVNSPRTRSAAAGSVLNAMHASLPYLGRSGSKLYVSTKRGINFVFLLFDLRTGELLSVMAADMLGRYRTGAASAVATKHLCPLKGFRLAIAGSGRQAVTQVLAMREVADLEGVSVWSPTAEHREAFARILSREHGIDSTAHKTVGEAFREAPVATTITTADRAFVSKRALGTISHLNACGANRRDKAEVSPGALASFSTICVDDLRQSREESGDLIQAVESGALSWRRVVELKDVVTSRIKPRGKTYFKSNGVAIEDVAVASIVYDKAVKHGGFREFEFRSISG